MIILKRFTPFFLYCGDCLALGAFVYVGQRDHNVINAASPLLGLLPTVLAFCMTWGLVAWWQGALPKAEVLVPRGWLTRSFTAWCIAGPLGIVARAFVLGRDSVPVSFFIAGFVFGGLFVLGWRLGLALVWPRLYPRKTPVPMA